MNPSFTPEQNKQLASWAGERDALLKVIGERKTEAEGLTKSNQALAESNTEISNKIQQSIGRLEELEKKEKERAFLTTAENAGLTAEKSALQTEVSSLKAEIAVLLNTKKDLGADIEAIIRIHESVFARAGEIERIVGSIASVSGANSREILSILAQARNELKEIIGVGEQHVSVTRSLVESVPKLIVTLHKDVIERRKAARAKIIENKPN